MSEDGLPLAADGASAGRDADQNGSWVLSAMVQVLSGDGSVVGAGFLATEDIVVTCAHVVHTAGCAPGDQVEVRFPHLPREPVVTGEVLAGPWRGPEAEDVAAIRLARTPAWARQPPFGSAAGCSGHRVTSFGFPVQAPERGHFGYGTAGDLLPGAETGALLQLTQANDLTTGFSGGPVVDEVTGLVIGMVTAITAPDTYHRGQGITYATPAEVLREVVPGLVEDEVSPYRGLDSFTVADSGWFHGRETAVDSVVAALRRHRLVLLLGPSGAGKSSLVQAGVLLALAGGGLPGSDRWVPVVTRPGQELLGGLERAGLPGATVEGIGPAVERRLAAEPDHDRLLVVIDQFEEFLTQPDPSPAAGQELAAVTQGQVPISVVLVMRDDFYPRLAALCPELMEAATPGLVNVPATLSTAELHAIISRPAQSAGARIEDGLPERIIEDLSAADPDRQIPATLLPPLQLALRQLWERRVDGRLTHEAYQRIGEVTGSLTAWCNDAIAQLPTDHRPISQRVLTALVRPADEANAIPATRQQLPLTRLRELTVDDRAAKSADDAVFDDVLAALSRNRIIITGSTRQPDGRPGEPSAELIHDTLIRGWGDLREWTARDHRFQVWLYRVTEQTNRHTLSDHPDDLLTGTALAEGLDWAEQRPLPADITAFLNASRLRQQTTLRRSRRLNAILAGALALALMAAGLAAWQRQEAVSAEEDAHSAETKLGQLRSWQLAAQSHDLLESDPEVAKLLAVLAYRTSRTDEARVSLFEAAGSPFDTPTPLTGHEGLVSSVVFSPDGRTLASAGEDGAVRLWDVGSGERRGLLVGHEGLVSSVAFSPNGKTLASAGEDETVRLWDVGSGERRGLLIGHEGSVSSVAFSPDGKTLAFANGALVRLLDVSPGKDRGSLAGHREGVSSVVFSPDGESLASAGGDGTVRLWDVNSGAARGTHVHERPVSSAAFSPNGAVLASAGSDGTVRLSVLSIPDADSAVRRICEVVDRDFTPAERSKYLQGMPDDPVCPESPGD